MTVKVRIPIAPIPASRPRVSKWGTYYEKGYNKWRDDFREWLVHHWVHTPLSGILDVEIVCICTKPKTTKLSIPKGDVDNYAKGVLDMLNGLAWQDDKQIHSLRITKRYVEKGEDPCIDVSINVWRQECEKLNKLSSTVRQPKDRRTLDEKKLKDGTEPKVG